jgi:hypothetical protein
VKVFFKITPHSKEQDWNKISLTHACMLGKHHSVLWCGAVTGGFERNFFNVHERYEKN